MLCLTFRPGDKMQIGDVDVKIGEIFKGKIRMYFKGPREISILRENAKEKRPMEKTGRKRQERDSHNA